MSIESRLREVYSMNWLEENARYSNLKILREEDFREDSIADQLRLKAMLSHVLYAAPL